MGANRKNTQSKETHTPYTGRATIKKLTNNNRNNALDRTVAATRGGGGVSYFTEQIFALETCVFKAHIKIKWRLGYLVNQLLQGHNLNKVSDHDDASNTINSQTVRK